MPTVNIDAENYITKRLGKSFSNEEFEQLCFEFGIELEEVTSEQQLAAKDGVKVDIKNKTADKTIYKIDIPANRYDMLCGEGISRAIGAYLGIASPPKYKVIEPTKRIQMKVTKETAQVRPVMVAAVLRNVTLTQEAYDSFIDLQDKLHNNICRKRTLVSIGTHDLDTVEGPFSYEAHPPKDISFIPLNQTQKLNGEQLMTFYENDRKLNKFLPIIRDKPVYPVVYDSNRTVLSLPPIINGDHSKIKLSTKNILIECASVDLTKAKVVLNTVCTMFSEYSSDKFTVEPVEVIYEEDGRVEVYPDLSEREVIVEREYINSRVGVELDSKKIASLLTKMSLSAEALDDSKIKVRIPPTRSDILHPCDIMEDVAISYGYNNIKETNPKLGTIAVQLPVNQFTDELRFETALAGYIEVLPFTLCSHDENFKFLNKKDNGEAVRLSNPKTVEYEVVRTSLLPGLLKTLNGNKRYPLPLRLFEVSDVVLRDDQEERRSKNQRNFCAIHANKTAELEIIHGLVDRIFNKLRISSVQPGDANGYYIKESNVGTFFPGRQADIFYKNKRVGTFGMLHPEVLENFEIPFPTSALELNIEELLA